MIRHYISCDDLLRVFLTTTAPCEIDVGAKTLIKRSPVAAVCHFRTGFVLHIDTSDLALRLFHPRATLCGALQSMYLLLLPDRLEWQP